MLSATLNIDPEAPSLGWALNEQRHPIAREPGFHNVAGYFDKIAFQEALIAK